MQRINLHRSLWPTLFLGAVAISGCKKDVDPPVVEEPVYYNIQGGFIQGGYDPATAQATVFDTNIAASYRSSNRNLFRWDMKTGQNRPLSERRDYRLDYGRVYYRQADQIWGGVEPSGNVYFTTEPGRGASANEAGPGLSLALRQPEDDAVYSVADLEGNFTCVRSLAPVPEIRAAEGADNAGEILRAAIPERVQLLSADFYPGSSTVAYRVVRSSYSADVETTAEESYSFNAADGSLRFTPVAGDAGVVMAEPAADSKRENMRAGGFNKQQQALFVAYVTADRKPTLNELAEIANGTVKAPAPTPEEVGASAYLMCLKGGAGVSVSNISGEYWFGSSTISRATSGSAPTFKPTFGIIQADGAGTLNRVECRSTEVARNFPMNYSVSQGGELALTSTNEDKFGVVSADGNLALLMQYSWDGSDMGMEIWTKKVDPSPCPTE